MRATRDLLRRRLPRLRTRAKLLAHLPKTTSQSNLPALPQKLASRANRARVAARFPKPAVQQRIEGDLAPIAPDDRLRTPLELALGQTAKAPDAQTFSRRRSLPGGGQIRARVLRYASQDLRRGPRLQEFVSSGRRGKWAHESAGKRSGTAGTKIGNAARTWAFAAAAVRFRRHNPAGQQDRARLTKQPGTGKALPVLAHKFAPAG